MKQGSNGKGRPRGGRNNNNQQPKGRGPSRNQTFDSNGPGVRVRGNAHQVVEKYQALARDAAASGDRVLMENYLQHAEHYYRIILVQNQNNPVKAQRLDQGNALVGDDDFEDEVNLADPQGRGAQVAYQGQGQGQGQGDRDQDQYDQDHDRDQDQDQPDDPRDRDDRRQEAAGRQDDGGSQDRKPRRRSRSARARDAGESERRDRETKDGGAEAPAAAPASAPSGAPSNEGPQSPAELAAAVTEREKKTRTRKPAEKAEAKDAGAEVHDLSEETPKKPRRRRARSASDDGDNKEVANG